MDRWSYFCAWAGSGDAVGAAQAFLTEASEDAAARLLDAALWRDEDVADFEERRLSVCIDGRWGRFWLASSELGKKALLPPAPRVSPRGVVALARGLVDVLQN